MSGMKEDCFYILHSGLVLPFKKSKYPTLDNAFKSLDKVVNSLFKDKSKFSRMMEKQHSIQTELYRMLIHDDTDTKQILL